MVHGFYSVLILLWSVATVYLVYLYIKNLGRGTIILSITTFFLIAYIGFCYIGATLLNIFYFPYEYSIGLYNSPEKSFNTWFYTNISLYIFLLTNFIFVKSYKKTFFVFCKKLDNTIINERLCYLLVVILFSISVLAFIIYCIRLDFNLPILAFFKGSVSSELVMLRSAATHDNELLGFKVYRYSIFYTNLKVLLLLIAFICYKTSKQSKCNWKKLFLILLLFSVISALANVEKGPLLNIVVILLIAQIWISRKKITLFLSLTIFSFLLFLGVLGYFLFVLNLNHFLEAIAMFFDRVFVGSISPFYFWQGYIDQVGYLFGKTFPNPSNLLPFENNNIKVEVCTFSNVSSYKDAICTMPVAFWAEGYANFGVIGIFLWSVILALIITAVDTYFFNKFLFHKHSINLAFYIYLIWHFQKYTVTLLSPILFDASLGLVLFFFVVIKSFSYRKIYLG